MSKENNLKEFLTDIADAVRSKTGKTEPINAQNLSSEIRSIESGEVYAFGETMVDKTGMGKTINTKIIVAEGVETIADSAYTSLLMSEVVFPYGLKTIGLSSFYNCPNFIKADIPNSVTFVAGYAFRSCAKLKNHRFPENVTAVNGVTYMSSGIETFVSEGKLTTIGSLAFSSSKLTFLVLRGVDSVATLVVDALKSTPIANGTGYIYVPDNLVKDYKEATNWALYADQIRPLSEYVYLDFADPVVEKICAENFGDGTGTTQAQANAVTIFPAIIKGNTEITSFDEFERFENVTDLYYQAFRDCTSLSSITFPNLKNLQGRVFFGCSSLDIDINLPSLITISGDRHFSDSAIRKVTSLGSITSLSAAMFERCTNLIEVIIPSTCATISVSAFYGCTALESIVCNPTTPPVLDSVIPYQSTAYVPDESVDSYKSATNWSKYAGQIKPLSEYQPNNE